jgi:hypothetical protein
MGMVVVTMETLILECDNRTNKKMVKIKKGFLPQFLGHLNQSNCYV